jgi:hypothetical protein
MPASNKVNDYLRTFAWRPSEASLSEWQLIAWFFSKLREVQESIKRGTLRIIPLPEQTQSWKADYDQMREAIFFNELPWFEEATELTPLRTSFLLKLLRKSRLTWLRTTPHR